MARTYEARPTLEEKRPPLLRAARWCASPSLWARRGCPQALTPPSEGPGWLEKGGRESSRSSPPYL